MVSDTVSQAMAIAEAAMTSIRGAGLAPTPPTFAVWYEFHAGRNAELRRVLSAIGGSGRTVDAHMMARIHDLFFGASSERRVTQEAQATLREAVGQIRDAGADAARYGSTLEDVAWQIERDEKDLAAIVAHLTEETSAMSARSMRLGDQLSLAGNRIAELEKQLASAHQAATTDALTALPNRRAFDSLLRECAGQAMNSGEDLCLLMIDIDHFKRVNDTWGHAVGDAVIRLVATTLSQQVTPPQVVARFGGEEFAVLLPATSLEDAIRRAEAMRATLATRRLSLRASAQPIGEVTVSVGAARYEPGEAVALWVERADAALYQAKREGRNRVVACEGAAVA